MQLKVWGCRGSVPTPGPETVEYGGNTSCVEVGLENESVLVLDAGTGIRGLGQELLEQGVRHLHLLLTHLHLDHLEGLRFFGPLWDPNVAVDVWGPPSPVVSLRERISRSFSPPLFPIDLRAVPSQVTFHDVPREPWSLEGARLTAALVMHPGPTLGYRLEADGATFAYLPDHEPALTGISGRPTDWISGASIAAGADVVFHDAQFSDEEYGSRIGWGHSSVDDAVAFNESVGGGRLYLFHHEPLHDDPTLAALEQRARSFAGRNGAEPTLAREGIVLDVA
jgi:phosphoribosyl 1,2-cyclic phosphodiesterase